VIRSADANPKKSAGGGPGDLQSFGRSSRIGRAVVFVLSAANVPNRLRGQASSSFSKVQCSAAGGGLSPAGMQDFNQHRQRQGLSPGWSATTFASQGFSAPLASPDAHQPNRGSFSPEERFHATERCEGSLKSPFLAATADGLFSSATAFLDPPRPPFLPFSSFSSFPFDLSFFFPFFSCPHFLFPAGLGVRLPFTGFGRERPTFSHSAPFFGFRFGGRLLLRRVFSRRPCSCSSAGFFPPSSPTHVTRPTRTRIHPVRSFPFAGRR